MIAIATSSGVPGEDVDLAESTQVFDDEAWIVFLGVHWLWFDRGREGGEDFLRHA